jgi:hypothetical protein
MQGEMGRTVYTYPTAWKTVTDQLRNRLLFSSGSQLQRPNVEIGISHNFNKICGCGAHSSTDATTFYPQEHVFLSSLRENTTEWRRVPHLASHFCSIVAQYSRRYVTLMRLKRLHLAF